MSPLHHYHHLALRRLDNSWIKSILANGCFGSFLRASAYQTATAATGRLCTTRVSTNFAQVEYGRLPVTRAEPNAEICFVVKPSRKLLHIAAYIYALHVQYNGTSTLSDAISDMSPSPTSPYSCPLGTGARCRCTTLLARCVGLIPRRGRDRAALRASLPRLGPSLRSTESKVSSKSCYLSYSQSLESTT
ncbi:hypothetical protein IG631_05947 [Alternaria alternata]|nr:hypothetical protein IG631_05947 [Alternaria alternata]